MAENWQKSVAAIVEHDGKILLVRHTYGAGKGRLIIPGGYLKDNETPQQACVREVLEETGITAEPKRLLVTFALISKIGMSFSRRTMSAAKHIPTATKTAKRCGSILMKPSPATMFPTSRESSSPRIKTAARLSTPSSSAAKITVHIHFTADRQYVQISNIKE